MRRVLSYLLIVLGLLGSIGAIGNIKPIRRFAQASMASPELIVYSEVTGVRLMRLRANVELELVDGERREFLFDKATYNRIAKQENPFNRHVMVLGYISAIILFVEEQDIPMRSQILRHGFCDFGPLTKYLSVDTEVRSLNISYSSPFSEDKIPEDFELACQKEQRPE